MSGEQEVSKQTHFKRRLPLVLYTLITVGFQYHVTYLPTLAPEVRSVLASVRGKEDKPLAPSPSLPIITGG